MKKNGFKRGAAGALAVAAVIALGVVNAAAQGHTGHTGQTGQQQTGHTGHGQMANMPFDLHYIDMTIMHHQQGIEMARLAEQKGQNARVKAFAKKTADDQQRDMMELRGHRQHWYSDRPEMDHSQMMSHMEMMPAGKDKTMMQDMMKHSQDDMAKLQAAEGAAFDRLFLDTMTHHHQMAVDMSKDAVAKAEHKEIKDFARKTITKQQGEIAEMNRIKAAVGGTTARRPAPKKKAAAKKPAAHAGHTGHQ